MKKFTSLLLTLLLVLGSMGTGFAASLTSDVSGRACEQAVKALSEAGVVHGYPDGTYKPEGAITRAEMTKLLVTALGYGGKNSEEENSFSDTDGHWAVKYIDLGKHLGLIKGYPDGTFRPDAVINYNEVVTMLVQSLGYAKPEGVWPSNFIEFAGKLGILGNVTISESAANRGDAAILLYQTWEKPIGTVVDGIWTQNKGNDTMRARLLGTALQKEPRSRSGSGNPAGDQNTQKGMGLNDIIGKMKGSVDGESAFDYMSYVYMGWRTTGGPWQNHVIRNFLVEELKNGSFIYADEDMSSSFDKDYVWIQQDDSAALAFAPQFASLAITSDGDPELISTFNVTAYGFDPLSEIYMDHFGEAYGIKSIDDMYQWITEKDGDGNRVNVLNGLEADLNKRAHLATNSCFTDPAGTPVKDARGVEGEVVYIGSVKSSKIDGATIYFGSETGIEGNSSLYGKVLLSDSSNRTTFNLAKQVGAVAIMTTYALDDYNNPIIDGQQWYTDSARYSGGARAADSLAQMNAGAPIVQWNLSLDQETALFSLLETAKESGEPVTIKSVAIGSIYPMAQNNGGEGQLTAIAEIAGTTKAHERVMFMAHVQEPGACDNASGVGLQLELTLKLKQMIDTGVLPRPARTITFFFGDEMACSRLWLQAHPGEQPNVVCTIDLDMVGEDPQKTGGPMRIEKTPDPSAVYNYTLDVLPGQDPYSDPENFVRLPDSHTLWGAGDVPDIKGLYLNDLYMASTQEVIRSADPLFQVAVCPYEGGSDHTVFLNAGIPSVLTWHFTDYIYHTTRDTLDMASAREMQSVGITSLAAGYMAAIAGEYEAVEMMRIVYDAAVERFALEALNTKNHMEWAKLNSKSIDDALALEIEVLNAWGTWYIEALKSCGEYFLGENPGAYYQSLEASYIEKINKLLADSLEYAAQTFVTEADEEPAA